MTRSAARRGRGHAWVRSGLLLTAGCSSLSACYRGTMTETHRWIAGTGAAVVLAVFANMWQVSDLRTDMREANDDLQTDFAALLNARMETLRAEIGQAHAERRTEHANLRTEHANLRLEFTRSTSNGGNSSPSTDLMATRPAEMLHPHFRGGPPPWGPLSDPPAAPAAGP